MFVFGVSKELVNPFVVSLSLTVGGKKERIKRYFFEKALIFKAFSRYYGEVGNL
jgi:hypothetical protein